MTLPVFVSSPEDPANEVLTYALIDSQSDKSYILQEISDSLFTARGKSQLKVSTITSSDQIQWSDHLLNLQIRGFSTPDVVTVKRVYSLKDIPANSEHIPTPQTAAGWPHLQHLAEKFTPLQGCKVGMIIGFPCSIASLPMEIVQCESDLTLPYAVRTILGWAIIGGQESLQIDPVVHQIHTLDCATDYVPEELQETLSVSHSRSLIQKDPKLLSVMDSSIIHDSTRRLPADSREVYDRNTETDTEPLSFLWYRDGIFDNPYSQIYVDGSKSSITTYGMERTATNLSDHNPGAQTSGAPRQDYQEVTTGNWIGKNHPTSQYNLTNLVPNSG